ncbi:MAG: LamG-like jellyroll fold domain-containing protein, partial [Candidatus Kapaibacterium sp.]
MKTSKFFTAILFVFSFFALNLHSDPGGMFKQIDTEPGSVGSYEMARMELEEGIIHTAWMSKAGDSSPEKVTYRRSTDNGKTFETPIDAIIPDEELTGLKQGTLKLEVNGDNVYISVLGGTTANGGWSEGLFFAKSNDGGKTFTKPKMLTEAKQYYKIDMVDMRIDGSAIYILTEERFNPDSYGKILIFKSTDNGDSFEQIIVEEAVDIHSKELLVQNGEIHILLYKSHYYYGFRWGILSMATSMDGGNIFNITEISEVVPDDENHRAMLDYDECTENRLMAKENDVLYVLWHEIPVKDGERCMMLSKSSDNGSSFTNKKVTGYGVDDVTGLGSIFDLKVKENNVNILQRRGGSGSMSHWLVHSSDGGNNFDAIKQIDVGWSFSNRGYGGFHSDFAEIISDNNDMLAIGLSPGRIRISYDGGKTFDKGFMLTEHYHALMNYNTSKFIYTDDAIYIIGYDRGSEKGIRFGKIELEEISENPDVNKSVKIANDAKFVHANICESPGLLDNSPSQFSISFWFKYECAEGEEGNTREIIRKHSEYQPVFNLQMIKGGLRGSIKTDKEFLHTEKGGTVVANKWQHYALTYNADGIDPNLIVYLDGIPVAEAFTTGNLLNEAGTILFGTTKNNDEDIYYYDDLNIWDRALSPKEIKDVALNSIQNVDKTSLLYYSDFNGSMYDAEHDIQAIALSAEYSDDVANPPNVDFSAVLNGFELLCINKTQNAENSHWDFDDGNTSDLANPTNVYKKYGEYNVSLTTENETTVFSAYLPTTVEGLAEIDKKKGTNNGSITIRLFGGGLGENDDFSLRTSSGKIIEPIMHTNPEAGVVEAIFDLSGQDPSICDVVAEVSGKEQVLEDAFEIIQADPDFKYELWIELHGRGAAIFNLWQTYTIVMGNNSDIDAYAVPFGLAISDFPGTEVEFMDFEIETPERAGYEFPTEIADLPLYAVLDEVNGEKLNARVYPFIIPVIPANSTISMRIRVKSPEDLSMRGWLMEPIVEYVGEGGITKQKDDELTNQAKADLAKCLIK